MTPLAQPTGLPTHRRSLHSSIKPCFFLIAILSLLYVPIFMTRTCESALLIIAMLTSLGAIQLATSSTTSLLAGDLQTFAMAALGTIGMLYLLA